jgi:hypothetical protein
MTKELEMSETHTSPSRNDDEALMNEIRACKSIPEVDAVLTKYHAAHVQRTGHMSDAEADAFQHWDKIDGATAWHLIERHADNWGEVGQMMDAFVRAKTKPSSETPERNYKALYESLLLAVGKKYPDETRHQTALRYILQAEEPQDNRAAQAMSQALNEGDGSYKP